MQDEHFMREWNAGHDQFSGDLGRTLLRMAQSLRRHWHVLRSIGKAYDLGEESPIARKAWLTGFAVIGGMTTGTGIAAVLLTLAAITCPAPGHAVGAICTAPPALA